MLDIEKSIKYVHFFLRIFKIILRDTLKEYVEKIEN